MAKVYLAGPMKGYKDFNFPAFHQAAVDLREEGYEVFSPAEKDIEDYGEDFFKGNGDIDQSMADGFSLRRALSIDTKYIAEEADAIAMLPGWEYSAGACAEWQLARALRLEFMYL